MANNRPMFDVGHRRTASGRVLLARCPGGEWTEVDGFFAVHGSVLTAGQTGKCDQLISSDGKWRIEVVLDQGALQLQVVANSYRPSQVKPQMFPTLEAAVVFVALLS